MAPCPWAKKETPLVESGFGKEEMKPVAELIVRVIKSPDSKKVRSEVRREVEQICRAFPVPGIDD